MSMKIILGLTMIIMVINCETVLLESGDAPGKADCTGD